MCVENHTSCLAGQGQQPLAGTLFHPLGRQTAKSSVGGDSELRTNSDDLGMNSFLNLVKNYSRQNSFHSLLKGQESYYNSMFSCDASHDSVSTQTELSPLSPLNTSALFDQIFHWQEACSSPIDTVPLHVAQVIGVHDDEVVNPVHVARNQECAELLVQATLTPKENDLDFKNDDQITIKMSAGTSCTIFAPSTSGLLAWFDRTIDRLYDQPTVSPSQVEEPFPLFCSYREVFEVSKSKMERDGSPSALIGDLNEHVCTPVEVVHIPSPMQNYEDSDGSTIAEGKHSDCENLDPSPNFKRRKLVTKRMSTETNCPPSGKKRALIKRIACPVGTCTEKQPRNFEHARHLWGKHNPNLQVRPYRCQYPGCLNSFKDQDRYHQHITLHAGRQAGKSIGARERDWFVRQAQVWTMETAQSAQAWRDVEVASQSWLEIRE